jgi:hypothetical protein
MFFCVQIHIFRDDQMEHWWNGHLLHTFHNSTFSRWHQIRFWTLDPLRKAENTRLFIIQRMIPGTTVEKPFRFFVCSTNVTTNNTHAYLLLRKKALQWQTRILHLNGTILNKRLMDKLKSLNTLLSSIQTNSNWTKDALIVEEAQSELLQAQQDTNEIISNGNLPSFYRWSETSAILLGCYSCSTENESSKEGPPFNSF